MARLSLLIVLVVCCCVATAQDKPNPWSFETKPDLPNVLVIGDSISIGYTLSVREILKDRANVYRPMNAAGTAPVNCASSYLTLTDKLIDKMLTERPWTVIHFNWGLWEITYCDPPSKRTDIKSKRDKVNGVISVTPEEYEQNLENLVDKLKKTGAVLIWASTTTVPEGNPGRKVGEEVKYNAIAEKVMKKHGIAIDDLHALTETFEPKLFAKPGDVHFSAAGSRALAEKVAEAIEQSLQEK